MKNDNRITYNIIITLILFTVLSFVNHEYALFGIFIIQIYHTHNLLENEKQKN